MSDSFSELQRGLIDYDRATEQEDKCAWAYHGAAGLCQRDATHTAYHDHLGHVPLCETHHDEGTGGEET